MDNNPALVQVVAWRTNTDPVHWLVYTELGGDELMESIKLSETWPDSRKTR